MSKVEEILDKNDTCITNNEGGRYADEQWNTLFKKADVIKTIRELVELAFDKGAETVRQYYESSGKYLIGGTQSNFDKEQFIKSLFGE